MLNDNKAINGKRAIENVLKEESQILAPNFIAIK